MTVNSSPSYEVIDPIELGFGECDSCGTMTHAKGFVSYTLRVTRGENSYDLHSTLCARCFVIG